MKKELPMEKYKNLLKELLNEVVMEKKIKNNIILNILSSNKYNYH